MKLWRTMYQTGDGVFHVWHTSKREIARWTREMKENFDGIETDWLTIEKSEEVVIPRRRAELAKWLNSHDAG